MYAEDCKEAEKTIEGVKGLHCYISLDTIPLELHKVLNERYGHDVQELRIREFLHDFFALFLEQTSKVYVLNLNPFLCLSLTHHFVDKLNVEPIIHDRQRIGSNLELLLGRSDGELIQYLHS